MSRHRKPASVEQVEHGPFKADIRLDKGTGIFSCEYGSQKFNSHVLPEVRSWARQTLRDLCSLNWKPVMEVNFDDEDARINNLRNCSNIECYIERFHAAWDGKKWIVPVGSNAARQFHVQWSERLGDGAGAASHE